MKKFILKALDIEPEEYGPVSLLLTISFFIGIFLVTFDVGTSTLFLTSWGQEHLAEAFAYSGILGVLASFIFAQFQRRIPFYTLAKTTFIISAIYVFGLGFLLESTQNEYLIYISFASLGPLNALGLLSFYGMVLRSFNIKNQKRLTGTVDQGQMFATSIAFFTIPIIQELSFFNKDAHFLYVSCGGVVISFFLLNLYFNKYRDNDLRKSPKVANLATAKVVEIARNPYTRLLTFLFLFSVIATFFVEFSFLSSTADQFKGKDSSQLASFLAYYGGTLTVFSLVLQVFLGDKIIETYGIKISLLILPVLLAIITMFSAVLGTFKATGVMETTLVFFIFIALTKFFLQSSKESFEEPIFKNFFLPVDKSIRADMQTKIEGVFQQFSVFIAGSILALLAFIPFFKQHYELYSFILILVFFGYAIVVVKIHGQYQKTLKDTLSAQKGKDGNNSEREFSVREALNTELKSQHHERVIYSLKLMEKIEPVLFESMIIAYASDKDSEIRKFAIERIHHLKLLSAAQSVKKLSEKETSPIIKQLAQEALKYMDQTENIPLGGPKLSQLVKSKNTDDREFAAKILSRASDDQSILHLLLLMRDPEPSVRLTAIVSAGKCKNQELWPLLIESLTSSVFGNAAAAAIVTIGDDITHSLEAAFHKAGQTLQAQIRIVQIYGKIGGEHAIQLLWSKIDFPSKKIRSQVLLSLSNCRFKVEGDKFIKIKQTLETAIGNAAWNVAALSEIDDQEQFKLIREALEEEIKNDNELIFLLLSFIYDAQSIRLVKENIDSGTVEGKLYGLELLDVFLEDDLQPLLFPLLEDISQEERNEKLQNHFPRESLDKVQVLLHIINRDYNYVNRWTKACAILSLGSCQDYHVSDDLIANLFNPDPLLRETSAWIIFQLDKKVYHETTMRLPSFLRKEMDEVILPGAGPTDLRFERILKLRQNIAFTKVPGVILADLEEITEYESFKKDEIIIGKEDTGLSPIYLILGGKAGIYENELLIKEIGANEIIGELLIFDSEKYEYEIKAIGELSTFKIEKNRFFELLSNNYELAKEFIQVVGSKWDISVAESKTSVEGAAIPSEQVVKKIN